MAKTVSILDELVWGNWARRSATNANARDLDSLHDIVEQQAQEILQLRAMVTGLIDALRDKSVLDETSVKDAIRAALTELSPPPAVASPVGNDPYRGLPAEPSGEAASELAAAQKLHYSKRFAEARAAYQQIVDKFGGTKEAAVAKGQVDNLRGA